MKPIRTNTDLRAFVERMAELNLPAELYPYFVTILSKQTDKGGLTPAEIVYEVFQTRAKPTDFSVFNRLLYLGFAFRADQAY